MQAIWVAIISLALGVALATGLATTALIQQPTAQQVGMSDETRLAVDCYDLFTVYLDASGEKDQDAAFEASEDRGCWP